VIFKEMKVGVSRTRELHDDAEKTMDYTCEWSFSSVGELNENTNPDLLSSSEIRVSPGVRS
jgi:hypothetical protein